MRKFVLGLLALAIFLCFSGCSQKEIEEMPAYEFEETQAVWISYIDLSSMISQDKSLTVLNFEKMIENCKKLNINTLYVHASAFTDAYYESDYYPKAKVLKSINDLDPLKEICSLAKKEGIKVEAWINPFRSFLRADMEELDDHYLLKKWVNDKEKNGKLIVEVNGRYYLNPYYEECRDLIKNVATELLEKYEISGIHMDDYFYPDGIDECFDASAYQSYLSKGGTLELKEFRKENVNKVVKELYDCVKSHDSNKIFGISPAGNISYSINSIYGDVKEWVQNPGYIDYIAPQIYFGFQHQTLDFVSCLNEWKALIQNPDVELIVGLAAYKMNEVDNYAGSGKNEWIEDREVLIKQVEKVLNDPACDGFSFFSYSYVFDENGEENSLINEQLQKLIGLLR